MSRDELAVMDGNKCILQLRGVRPFYSDKFDITKHKRYKQLSDYDKKNEFHVEEYMKHQYEVLNLLFLGGTFLIALLTYVDRHNKRK